MKTIEKEYEGMIKINPLSDNEKLLLNYISELFNEMQKLGPIFSKIQTLEKEIKASQKNNEKFLEQQKNQID